MPSPHQKNFNVLRKKVLRFVKTILPFHAAAWKASSEPIRCMLQEPNDQAKDNLTAGWKDSTEAQLSTISLTGALFGGVIATSFTWPTVARLSASDQATVIAIWYSALLFAITSIAISAQQVVVLRRLGSHPEGLEKIRTLLGKNAANGPPKPRNLQLFIWQAPLSLLNLSGVMFVVGLIVLVWKSVSLDGNDTKIVVVFTLTLAYSMALYVVSAYGLYQ